jgi:hypothetical protein
MKVCFLIIAVLCSVFCVNTVFACWAAMPLGDIVKSNAIIVTGKIETITPAGDPAKEPDIGHITVTGILKNESGFAIAIGQKLSLGMPAAKRTMMMSTDIRYPKGSEGVWLLEQNKKIFWATYPGDLQKLDKRDEIVKIIAKQAEIAALAKLVAFQGKGGWGFKDAEGTVIVNPAYSNVHNFTEGLAAVEKDGKWGYINGKGDFAAQPVYATAQPFSEGLGLVSHNGKYGFLDTTGKVKIKLQFSNALSFKSNLAAVCLNGKWGYVYIGGAICIKPAFEQAGYFSEGKAAVMVKGKYGYINQGGTLLIPAKYDSAGLFKKGQASVMLDNKIGTINAAGKVIQAFAYIED